MKNAARHVARWLLAATALLLTSSAVLPAAPAGEAPLAYVGPGPGLGLIGSLLAVLAVVLIGLLGLVLYPLRLWRQWRRRKAAAKTGDGGAPPVSSDRGAARQ